MSVTILALCPPIRIIRCTTRAGAIRFYLITIPLLTDALDFCRVGGWMLWCCCPMSDGVDHISQALAWTEQFTTKIRSILRLDTLLFISRYRMEALQWSWPSPIRSNLQKTLFGFSEKSLGTLQDSLLLASGGERTSRLLRMRTRRYSSAAYSWNKRRWPFILVWSVSGTWRYISSTLMHRRLGPEIIERANKVSLYEYFK